ncbi:MAG: hypothetical protein HGA86_06635 [Anaerolineaceae bacterium]|nr:hypothetical protein [Anaerolineaceae bacterium]
MTAYFSDPGYILNNLGDLQRLLGDYESAITNLEKSCEQARLTGHMRMEAYSLTSIGDLYADLDAFSQAMEAYSQARQLANRIQHVFLQVYMDAKQAAIHARQGEPVASQKMFENAWMYAEQHHSNYEMNLVRLERGCVHVNQGEFKSAMSELSQAVEYFTTAGFQVEALRAGIYLAVAGYLSQPGEQTQEFLIETLARASGMENRKAILPAMRLLLPVMEPMAEIAAVQPYLAFFNNEVIEFEKGMNQLKRKLRRQVTVVPFAPPKIFITALGRGQVRVNEHVITSAEWVSQVSRDLLFFTLAHQDGVTKESVGEVFWPGSSPAEVKLRFKNAIYRMRTAVGKDVVVFEDEIYRFNNLMDYEFDLESYYRELYRAERAADPKQKLVFYQQALRLYQGPYLPDTDIGWFVTERTRLQQVHLNTLVNLSTIYMDENDFYNCLQICQLALNTDPCLEPAHRLAMRAFSASGNRAGLVRQYELCRQALKEELNSSPSEQTRGLYHSLLK